MRSAVEHCSTTYNRCSVAAPGLSLPDGGTAGLTVTEPAYFVRLRRSVMLGSKALRRSE